MTMTESEIMDLFYDKFCEVPLLSRMDAVFDRFKDEYETLYRVLSEEESEILREKFDRMYVTKDLYKIYNWLLEELEFPGLADVPPERRFLEYEDVYPLLYLKYRLQNQGSHKTVRHLVVDEMQDYSYLQYRILELLFPCGKTILGDRAQTVDGEQQDVMTFLPRIFGRDSRKIEINKSYRNTIEIAEYAEKICAVPGIEYFERHGKPVEEIFTENREKMIQDILKRINLSDSGFETAAVLTMTEREAEEIAHRLSQEREDVSYINRDSAAFRKGVTVTTYYLAKGLEFDQVFVVNADERLTEYRQYQYISATRAMHELYVYRVSGLASVE